MKPDPETLIERLRKQAADRNIEPDHTMMLEAADHIERQRTEIEQLWTAIKDISAVAVPPEPAQ